MKNWPSLTMAQRMLRKGPNRDKLVHIAHDLLDNSSLPTVHTVERTGEQSRRIREHIRRDFLPEAKLQSVLERFDTPGIFQSHDVAGRSEEKTAHGHRFVVISEADRVRLLFLDPEHHVGERNLFRPSICNIVAINIPRKTEDRGKTEIGVLRVRTAESNPETLDSFITLQNAALDFLDTGKIPEIFTRGNENVSFLLHSTPERSQVRTRYADMRNLKAYAEGGITPSVIRTKAQSLEHILAKFLRRDFKEKQTRTRPQSDAA